MPIDLQNYSAIQSNYFIKIEKDGTVIESFSDLIQPYTIDGVTFQAVGDLLAVSEITNELRASPQEIQISVSGVPNSNINTFLNQRIKGSKITIYRGFFDPNTEELLSGLSENPAVKFRGFVSNYEITDELQIGSNEGSVKINISCASEVFILDKKTNNRRTNPLDFDNSQWFEKVYALSRSNFNFGAED